MLAVPASPAEQRFSREDVQRVLQISARQLRSWEKQGLISERSDFALNDLLALKTLLKLRENHVAPQQVKRAVTALRVRIRNVTDPLTQLRIYSEGGQIRVDIEGNTMEPVSGQLLLNFGPAEIKKLLSFPGARAGHANKAEESKKRAEAELLFEKGLEMEHSGAPLAEVIAVYEHALKLDPTSTGALVNLGTIHFNGRKYDKAEAYYLRAIEADPEYALAHFNLGNLYDEQGKRAQALDQYLIALRGNPRYADAHYNVALLYQTAGETMKAVLHWKAYLKLDSGNSNWAAIARRELAKLKDATIVRGRA
jgi:tetratricopeptide (TPR) repeat protein